MNASLLLAVLIVAPLALGLAALAARNKGLRHSIVVLAAVVVSAAAVLLAMTLYQQGQPIRISLPAWSSAVSTFAELAVVGVILAIALRIKSPIIVALGLVQLGLALAEEFIGHGIRVHEAPVDFLVDWLSLILVLIVSLVGSVILVYAIGYMREHERHAPTTAASSQRFFLVLIGFLGLMNGLVMANNLRWLSIFWELTTLCSFLLIGHDGTPRAKASAKRALLINAFGGAAMLLASVLALSGLGVHTVDGVMAGRALIPMALLCLAALTKSAQMPFQSWLLGAMVAPTPVSALLHSATMVKAGAYLVLRLAPAFAGTELSPMIALIGAFTFAATAALAVGQSNGKKVLAYSTISNLGLIITCAGVNTPLAYAGALFILCFHAVSKGLLFLCIGTIEQRIGSRDIEDMGRIMYLMPATTIITLVGMVSMLLAPFGMLVGKWLAIESAIHAPIVLVLIIVGSALTIVFWAKWIGRIQTVSYHKEYHYEKLAPSMILSMLTLVLPVVVAGLVTIPLYRHLAKPLAMATYPLVTESNMQALQQIDQTVTWPFYLFIGLASVMAAITLHAISSKNIRQPFLCGENIGGSERTYVFRSLMDKQETAWVGTYYLRGAFSERRMTIWCNLVAGLLVLTMFGALGVI